MNHHTDSPLISFIITCYNTPIQMLKECIDSVLALPLHDAEREIIVVDDGSASSSASHLEAYKDRISYVYKENGGASTARNMGMEMAKGEYVQLIDGDDKLTKDTYEHCIDIIRQQGVDAVLFDFSQTNNHNTRFSDSPIMTGAEYMANHNLLGTIWSMVFRRSILGNLRFTPGIVCVEDEEFKPLLVVRARTLVHTDAQAYFYRENTDSTSHQLSMDRVMQRIYDMEHIAVHLNAVAQKQPVAERTALNRRVAQLTMDHLYNVITLTQSKKQLFEAVERLRSNGLFPLPKKDYTLKYKWFHRLSNSPLGLHLLYFIALHSKAER